MSQNTQYVSTVILVFVDLKECLMHLHVTISFAANTVNILNNKLNDFLCVGLLVITRQLFYSWWLLHIWNFFVRKLSLWVLFAFLFSQLISAEKSRDEAQGELAKYTEVTITSWIAVGNQLEKLCLKLFCLFLLFLGHARATGSKRSVGVWTGRNVTVVCKLIVTCLYKSAW